MSDGNEDYHMYEESAQTPNLRDSEKNIPDSSAFSSNKSGTSRGRRPSLSVPDVKGAYKNTVTGITQGADTFVEDIHDMV